MNTTTNHRVFKHFAIFGGSGGISIGMNRASASVGRFTASTRCLGSIDVDPAACRDFERLTGTKATCLDLFDLDDFRAFHGPCKVAKKRCGGCNNTGEPPPGWREATPDDIRRAAGGEYPDILVWSPPCKGFSGLLNSRKAASLKYQALNNLTVRALVLFLAAFADDLPKIISFENVPRIRTRGRHLLDTIIGILESAGYRVAETVHDCGEIGGLAQHRKRFLLVARLASKVEPFVYEPPKRRVRGVGEVLGELPLPDDEAGGPMHRLPRLQWKTWLRLALIQPGKDWRSLNDLEVVDGKVRGLRVVQPVSVVDDPRCHTSRRGSGKHKVSSWAEPAGCIIGASTTGQGATAVADPRAPRDLGRYEPYGVKRWADPSSTITSQAAPGAGHFSVADPRLDCDANDRQKRRHNNVYRIVRWDETATTVTGASGNSRPNVADPRPSWGKTAGGAWANSGHYGVRRWEEPTHAVVGNAKQDKGAWSVADPRLPEPREQCKPLILSLWGTWNRPFTTYELAVIQGFPTHLLDGRPLKLDGTSDSDHRMRIGNAVPIPTFEAAGGVFLDCMLRQELGQSFSLTAMPIWVQPIATLLSLEPSVQGGQA